MPKVAVYNTEGTSVGEIELRDDIFGVEINEALLYQVVRCSWPTNGKGLNPP